MGKHRGRGVSHEGRERERSEDTEDGWRQMSGHIDRQRDGSRVMRAEKRGAQRRTQWGRMRHAGNKEKENLQERERKSKMERYVVVGIPFIYKSNK